MFYCIYLNPELFFLIHTFIFVYTDIYLTQNTLPHLLRDTVVVHTLRRYFQNTLKDMNLINIVWDPRISRSEVILIEKLQIILLHLRVVYTT